MANQVMTTAEFNSFKTITNKLDKTAKASEADVTAGTNDTKFVTAKSLKQPLLDAADSAASGLFQFKYRVSTTPAATAIAKHIAFDQVGTTAGQIYKPTTKLYIHKKDKAANDMTLFLDGIDKGDYFNIHDNNNVNQYVAFDVIGKPVKTGDVYAVPVAWYAEAGTFTDGEIANIHWNQHDAMSSDLNDLEHNIGDIHSFVAGKDLATKLMELKQQVDKNTHTTSTSGAAVKSAGILPVYSDVGFEYIDVPKFIQDPANPGHDITDGSSNYVTVAVETGKTLNSNSTWCWTKEQTPARMFTNAAKSQAVSPMELHAWIASGALIKIKKTGADWFVEDVHIPATVPGTASKALVTKGTITDVHDITEMGVYSGTDVANAPAQGSIIIEAYEDAKGDLDLSLKDQTNRRYEGGVPKGGTATWHHVAADHLFGTADPASTLGNDGDLYFKIS